MRHTPFPVAETAGDVTFFREPGDPKFYGFKLAAGEHKLFHFLKRKLNEEGNDLIKKRIQKDGHMMGDQYQPYIRTRKRTSKGLNIQIFSGFYALHGANEDWNKDGEVTLEWTVRWTDKPLHFAV